MRYLRKNKGITLIALVITIIMLLILAGTTINMLSGENGILKKASEAKEKSESSQRVEEERLANLEELIKNNGDASLSGYNENKGINSPKLSESKEDLTKQMIPIKYNGTNWVVCTEEDEGWYNYSDKSVTTTDGKTVEPMTWANAMLSDGTYKAGKVKEGQVVEEKELGSMFVWIPRFAYSMSKYKTTISGTADEDNGKTQNITKVEFLKGSSNIGAETGKKYGTDYNADTAKVGEETPMIVHPAFTFGGANLKGIWVAKFEASMKETNTNDTTNNNDNALQKTVKILPNEESWRYINEGNIFKVCLNMKDKTDYQLPATANTHQMKNSEWGAVAYLAASQYGKVPVKNASGKSYTDEGSTTTKYHSYTGNGDYKAKVAQSTTRNITGVYDMNGGASEYVAAYWDNGKNNLAIYGSKEVFPGNKLDSKYIAYFDAYEVSGDDGLEGYNAKSSEGNKLVAEAAYQRVQLMKKKKGDAMYEIINEFSYYGRYTADETKPYESSNWFKATYDADGNATAVNDSERAYGLSYYGEDYELIGNSALPFVVRGGSWGGATYAGVFASLGSGGTSSSAYGFRPVVVF